MTDLAASNITVTIPAADRDMVPAGPKLISAATITFGDGALTYPTGGIPLPAMGNFGFKKEIRAVWATGISGKGNLFEFDKANHKLRGFVGHADGGMAEMSGAVAAQSVDLLLVGE